MAEADEVRITDEVATFVKVSTKTLLKPARGNHLPVATVGDSWRFVRGDLLRFWAGALEPAK